MKPVYRLSWCLRCGPTVGPLWFPLPPPFSSVQSPPPGELTWKDLYLGPILVADWPGEGTLPQGFTTNGDSAAWLIGRGQVASLHFSFFCFNQQPLHCLSPPHLQLCFVTVERCGPVHVFRHRCLPLNTSWIISSFTICCRFFSWLLRSTLGWLLLWTLSPESCVFEVSDRYFSSPHVTCFKLFFSVLKERYTFYMNKHK